MIPRTVVKNLRVAALICAVILSSCTSSSEQKPHQADALDKVCTGAAGEVPGETCMPETAIVKKTGPCRQEGESFEGKTLGEACCPGLTPIDSTYPSPQAKCMRSAPPSVMVCTQCGNKICGKGENWCNCPADCKDRAKL
jgi:hypothetical protein